MGRAWLIDWHSMKSVGNAMTPDGPGARRPDMVVGNYSDGNLVASIMAHRLEVTQCTIAHALEKTKYKASDLRCRAAKVPCKPPYRRLR